MASKIIEGATAPAHPSDGGARRALHPDMALNGVIDTIRAAGRLLDLVQWVERARRLVDDIVMTAENEPPFAESLRDNGVAFNDAPFEFDASEGLSDVLAEAALLLETAQADASKLRVGGSR